VRAFNSITVTGIILMALAVPLGIGNVIHDEHVANTDFAACAQDMGAPGCSLRPAEQTAVGWTISSSNGFQKQYHVTVATSPHTFYTVAVSREMAAKFQGQNNATLIYHSGRLTAIVSPDGSSSVKVPFSFTKQFFLLAGLALLLFLAGGGLLTWGLVRWDRSRRRPPLSVA
jgi:hypothetical protein